METHTYLKAVDASIFGKIKPVFAYGIWVNKSSLENESIEINYCIWGKPVVYKIVNKKPYHRTKLESVSITIDKKDFDKHFEVTNEEYQTT